MFGVVPGSSAGAGVGSGVLGGVGVAGGVGASGGGSCLRNFFLSLSEIELSAPAMANVDDASNLRRTNVMSVR